MTHRPDSSRLRTLFFTLVIGVALCSSPGATVESDEPPTLGQENFRLVDEGGNSTTNLGIDPHIDPPQVGLDPTAIVTAHNILGLAFQQSAAARQLWFIFAGVGLGLLIFFAGLVRLTAQTRTVTALPALWALAFSVFAYLHWTALDTVQQQYRLLTRLIQHAADQAAAPDFLGPLAATIQPFPESCWRPRISVWTCWSWDQCSSCGDEGGGTEPDRFVGTHNAGLSRGSPTRTRPWVAPFTSQIWVK